MLHRSTVPEHIYILFVKKIDYFTSLKYAGTELLKQLNERFGMLIFLYFAIKKRHSSAKS